MKNKVFLLLSILICFSSCKKNKQIKVVAESIVNADVNEIDSIFEVNRPITSYFLDSVLINKPSEYFGNLRDYFNNDYYLSVDGGNYSNVYYEHYLDYRNNKEAKEIRFTFIKKEEWSLRRIELIED